MKYIRNIIPAVVILAATTGPAFAEAAQPVTTEGVAYIVAGTAAVLAALGSKYIIGAAMFVGRAVLGAFR